MNLSVANCTPVGLYYANIPVLNQTSQRINIYSYCNNVFYSDEEKVILKPDGLYALSSYSDKIQAKKIWLSETK